MKSRGKKLILWLLAAALMIGAMPAAVLGDEKDMEIPITGMTIMKQCVS